MNVCWLYQKPRFLRFFKNPDRGRNEIYHGKIKSYQGRNGISMVVARLSIAKIKSTIGKYKLTMVGTKLTMVKSKVFGVEKEISRAKSKLTKV